MQFVLPGEIDQEGAGVVRELADAAVTELRELLPGLADTITLTVVVGGPLVIPDTGDGGASMAPGAVTWAVDAARPGGIAGVARRYLRATLFHELHHQARGWVMHGSTLPTWFMEGVVSEGLATAFARDEAGEDAPWAKYPDDVDRSVQELLQLPDDANYLHWMFFHPDGRPWIGYRAGTYLADQAITASGMTAAELVNVDSREIVRLAGFTVDSARD